MGRLSHGISRRVFGGEAVGRKLLSGQSASANPQFNLGCAISIKRRFE